MEIKLSLQKDKLKYQFISIILCAGEGKRISNFIEDMPKSLIEVNNKPILLHLISNLVKSGISSIIIITGHLNDKIENFISSLKSKDTSLQNIITLVNSGTDYKKGPLYSFLSITKKKNLLREDSKYLVFPGDTYFDNALIHEIFTSIINNITLIERYPIIFYQKIQGIVLKNRKPYAEFISVLNLDESEDNSIVKHIQKRNSNSIGDDEYINLVIPMFLFNYYFINEIMKAETKLSVKTLREIVNFLIKENELVYGLSLNPNYNFLDIDTKTDLMMEKKR